MHHAIGECKFSNLSIHERHEKARKDDVFFSYLLHRFLLSHVHLLSVEIYKEDRDITLVVALNVLMSCLATHFVQNNFLFVCQMPIDVFCDDNITHYMV